ncbi:DUF1367 family protein, partial [Aeromonas hydrophila]
RRRSAPVNTSTIFSLRLVLNIVPRLPLKLRGAKSLDLQGANLLTYDYWEPVGGMVSPAEQGILTRFVRYLSQFGAGHILWKAKDEFIDQLAKCRVERHGPQAEKSFEVMRKWLTVEAGYYTTVMLPDGGVRKEAKSIKFGKMDQAEFADLYRAVFGVCWRYVLNRKFSSEAEAENAVAQLMGFAG